MTDRRNFIIESDMAWDSNVLPGVIIFNHTVPYDISQAILSTIMKSSLKEFIDKDATLTSLKPVNDPAGHYCLNTREGKYFIRVSRRKRKNPLMENKIISYLSDLDISVNLPVISGITMDWKGHKYLLAAFNFIEGRHFDGTDDDLILLSQSVARLHKALSTITLGQEICTAARESAERLLKTKSIITDALKNKDFSIFHERSEWARRNYDWLLDMVELFNPYLCKMPDSQCIHGELHLGNVIFTLDNGSIIFTDFEETPDSWFPPSFDIAYVVHRFCMWQNPTKNQLAKRMDILDKYYGELPSELKDMMRQVCWYNIALLVYRSMSRESFSPEEEYDKFVRLERLTSSIL